MSLSSSRSLGAPGQVPGAFSALDPEQVVADLWHFIDNPGTRFGTGWSMDSKCGLVGVGELALTIARSGSGKSTWYMNVIRNTPHVPTLVVNMEMTPRLQMLWLLAMTYHLETPARDLEEVMRAGPDDTRWVEIRDQLNMVPKCYPDLHFVMPNRPRVDDIAIIIDDIEDQTGIRPKRVFIDHMKYLAGSENEYQGYTQNSARAKEVAMESQVAMFLLQQTGRRDAGEANDGHIPVKFGSGLYGGEDDADWMFGLYRPGRDPRFKKGEHQFNDRMDYLKMQAERRELEGLVRLQCVKNRVFSELEEDGLYLRYDPWTRRLAEEFPNNDR